MNYYPMKAYGVWAGNKCGIAYVETRCAEEVAVPHSWEYRQCSRKGGHGDRGLFCKAHARRHPVTEDK